jgi:23S rRNA pseudouridine1911/1915/1917 synthase
MLLRDRVLAMHPGSSRSAVKGWLEANRVRVNDRIVRRGDVAVSEADRVQLAATPPPAFPAAFLRLVHEDPEILVVDKPAGLLTMATEHERERTAYRVLRDYVAGQPGRARLFIVHRLDRETSGLIVFAKTPEAKRKMQEQFEHRAVERVYVAVVDGQVREASGVLRDLLAEERALRVRPTRDRHRGKEAITAYRVLERRRETTVLELTLTTGRRGQIRAQLADLGHPVVGDRRYGSRRDPLRRVCLHATRLGFVHPSGARARFESPAPPAFRRLG